MILTQSQFINNTIKRSIAIAITASLVVFLIVSQVSVYDAFEAHVANVVAKITEQCEDGYTITGHKFNDANQNGIFDDGESGIEGWIISLQKGPYDPELDYDSSGTINIGDFYILSDVFDNLISCPAGKTCDLDNDNDVDTDDLTIMIDYINDRDLGNQITTGDGNYTFSFGVSPGSFIISEVEVDGWNPTTDPIQYITVGECVTDVDFGNFRRETRECSAFSIGYWQNHEGCPESSIWTNDVVDLSNHTFQGYFDGWTGVEICEALAPRNCGPGGTLEGKLCRAQGKTLANLLNLVTNNLQLSAIIAGADDGSDAFDNLGLDSNSTIQQALDALEIILKDPNHTKEQLSDANYVGERVYAFYEDENPEFPICLFSWDPPVVESQSEPLILGVEITLGCTDEIALNYNIDAIEDDGTCKYEAVETSSSTPPLIILGCTDELANNYNTEATEDDVSCTYDILGCTDETALNYNIDATEDDTTCEYEVIELPETSTTTPPIVILGCTDEVANNYNIEATEEDNSCTYTILGCLDETANNYNVEATEDDASCTYNILGCTDETANNYNIEATEENNSCTYTILGCTDETAINYSPDATKDDNSCEFEPEDEDPPVDNFSEDPIE